MKRRHGFTLVELLVVIAILAVLVAMLLPGLSRAKDVARDTVCKTNMKGVLVASHNYEADFASLLPTYITIAPGSIYTDGATIGTTNSRRQGQTLLLDGGYFPPNTIAGRYDPVKYTPGWYESKIRRINPLACPNGKYWGNNNQFGYNSSPPAWTSEMRDVLDTEVSFFDYLPPAFIGQPVTTSGGYSVPGRWSAVTSYVINTAFYRRINTGLASPNSTYSYSIKTFDRIASTPSKDPSRKMFWIEGAEVGDWTDAAHMSSEYTNSLTPSNWRMLRVPHVERLNWAAYDGHVAVMERSAIAKAAGIAAATLNAASNAYLPFDF